MDVLDLREQGSLEELKEHAHKLPKKSEHSRSSAHYNFRSSQKKRDLKPAKLLTKELKQLLPKDVPMELNRLHTEDVFLNYMINKPGGAENNNNLPK